MIESGALFAMVFTFLALLTLDTREQFFFGACWVVATIIALLVLFYSPKATDGVAMIIAFMEGFGIGSVFGLSTLVINLYFQERGESSLALLML